MAPVSPATAQTRVAQPRLDESGISKFFGRLFALLLLAVCAWGGYYTLDEKGWITHSQDTITFIKGDWMEGEIRNCSLFPTTEMYCSDAYTDPLSHVLPVKFHGKIQRPEKTFMTWRCQRHPEALECWALD